MSYNEAAGVEVIALHSAMFMPALLLQRCGPIPLSEMNKARKEELICGSTDKEDTQGVKGSTVVGCRVSSL